MKIYDEVSLKDFHFWGGAVSTAEALNSDDMQTVEDLLNEWYPEGLSATQVNDIFWFDADAIAQMIGFDSWEEYEQFYSEG